MPRTGTSRADQEQAPKHQSTLDWNIRGVAKKGRQAQAAGTGISGEERAGGQQGPLVWNGGQWKTWTRSSRNEARGSGSENPGLRKEKEVARTSRQKKKSKSKERNQDRGRGEEKRTKEQQRGPMGRNTQVEGETRRHA